MPRYGYITDIFVDHYAKNGTRDSSECSHEHVVKFIIGSCERVATDEVKETSRTIIQCLDCGRVLSTDGVETGKRGTK